MSDFDDLALACLQHTFMLYCSHLYDFTDLTVISIAYIFCLLQSGP